MSFKTETKEFIKEAHEEFGGSIYPVVFVFVGFLVLLGYIVVWTFPWGILAVTGLSGAIYGIYKAIQWAEKEEVPVPNALQGLSMDEAHKIAMKEDPSYKQENDEFWGQIADETEKIHGDRDFTKGPIERVRERVKDLQKKA